MPENFDLARLLIAILPILLAITLHEAAHAYMAQRYGDNTAAQLGRVTLNPISHIDPIGTIVVPLAMYLMAPTGFIFGWAKPVPVITRNFKDVRMGMRMVAIAGPLANILMAIAWAVIYGLSLHMDNSFSKPLGEMSAFGMTFNVVLFVLNMLPILPLDGGRFLDTFLPIKASMEFQKIEPYGTWILLFLLFTKVLYIVMDPMVEFILMPLFGLIGLISGMS